ncbi:MAG: methyltransferase domain-containing protein [Gemmatimonadetes bacterium]|nr:methyltransferase domain-containing protein [Gemmatimonadota bacterium]
MAARPSTAGIALRVVVPEVMDDPELDPVEHERALRALARVNRLSGTAGRIWREILRAARDDAPIRVMEVACGGGDVAVALAARARSSGLPLSLTATDRSERAVRSGRKRAERAGVAPDFVVGEAPDGLPQGPWDLVYASLFLHHLAEAEAQHFLTVLGRIARRVVVDDLRRTSMGLALATVAGHVLTRSPVVRVDGPRSVRAAFAPEEVEAMARRAGLRSVRVRRSWPQRWTLTADGSGP